MLPMMQRMLRFVPPALKGFVDLERVISEFLVSS